MPSVSLVARLYPPSASPFSVTGSCILICEDFRVLKEGHLFPGSGGLRSLSVLCEQGSQAHASVGHAEDI